jgi:DNA-binding NtrC family response regulator
LGDRSVDKVRLARAIHDRSRRRGAFAHLACTGLPDTLIASEIVGHRNGSFPGAMRDKGSAFAWRAHGGTLVLGDTVTMGRRSRLALARLLRFGEVIPLGAAGSVGTVDVRVILTAESPLDGSWREDLGPVIEIDVTRRPEEHAWEL